MNLNTPEDLMLRLRKSYVGLMRKTLETIGHVIAHESLERLTTLTDGPDGWTVTEVIAHLYDFDGIFRMRAEMIVNQDYPQLPGFDHEQMAIDRNYRAMNPHEVYAKLVESRNGFSDFFKSLSDEQWERAGVHPEKGHFTMMDAVMQVGTHDANHLEQITRILTQSTKP